MYKTYLVSYKSNFRAYLKANPKSVNYSIIKINPSELYTDSKDITWEDENKEVVYKGNLYDIESIKTEKRKVVLEVISDEDEEELKKQFAEVLNNDNSNSLLFLVILRQYLAIHQPSKSDRW